MERQKIKYVRRSTATDYEEMESEEFREREREINKLTCVFNPSVSRYIVRLLPVFTIDFFFLFRKRHQYRCQWSTLDGQYGVHSMRSLEIQTKCPNDSIQQTNGDSTFYFIFPTGNFVLKPNSHFSRTMYHLRLIDFIDDSWI